MLYYILVKRLLEQKPTILQNHAQHLFFFNAKGVKAVSPSNFADPESREYQNMWALVDINPRVREPADMVGHENSPFFLVMASSPRPSRLRGLQKHGRLGAYWLMKPFTLTELIQALVFLTSISSFVTYVASPVVNFNQLSTMNRVSRTSLKSTVRRPVIATISARTMLSNDTLSTSAARSMR